MTSVKKYIESNKDRFIEELFSLIRIPSISAKHEHKPDMEACAKRWTELLLAAGADKAVVMQRWFLLRRRPFWSIRTMT